MNFWPSHWNNITIQATLYKLDSEDVENLIKDHPHHRLAQNGSHGDEHDTSKDTRHSEKRNGTDGQKNDIQYEDSSDSETSLSSMSSRKKKPVQANGKAAEKESGKNRNFDSVNSEEEDEFTKQTRLEREEKERKRPKVKGKILENVEEGDLKERAQDALHGGILEIRPKKAADLVRKPWYVLYFTSLYFTLLYFTSHCFDQF